MIFNLKATPRKTVKKSDLHNLRAEGLIPAVLYGPQMESIAVSISKSEFTQMYKKSFAEAELVIPLLSMLFYLFDRVETRFKRPRFLELIEMLHGGQ